MTVSTWSALAPLVVLFVVAMNAIAFACQYGNCNNDCQMYTLYGSSAGCVSVPDGQYWKTTVSGSAGNPLLPWEFGGPLVTVESYESCCLKCLGNRAATVAQEAYDPVGYIGFTLGYQNVCKDNTI